MEKKCFHCGADLSGIDTFRLAIRSGDYESGTVDKTKDPLAYTCIGKDECRDITVDFAHSLSQIITLEIESNKPKMTKKERIDLCVLHIDTILTSCKLDETNQWRWDYLKKMLESVE